MLLIKLKTKLEKSRYQFIALHSCYYLCPVQDFDFDKMQWLTKTMAEMKSEY